MDQKLGKSAPAGIIVRDYDVAEIDPRVHFSPSLRNTVQKNDQSIIKFPLTRRGFANSSTSHQFKDKSQNDPSNSSTKNLCKICHAADINARFFPCILILSCLNCAWRVKDEGYLICRTAILTIEKVILG